MAKKTVLDDSDMADLLKTFEEVEPEDLKKKRLKREKARKKAADEAGK